MGFDCVLMGFVLLSEFDLKPREEEKERAKLVFFRSVGLSGVSIFFF